MNKKLVLILGIVSIVLAGPMMADRNPETITVTFAGINYPPYPEFPNVEVNRAFTLDFVKEGPVTYYLFEGEPDENGISPWVKVNGTGDGHQRVLFRLNKNGGVIISDVFFARGDSPLQNTIVILGVPYGGTATLTED